MTIFFVDTQQYSMPSAFLEKSLKVSPRVGDLFIVIDIQKNYKILMSLTPLIAEMKWEDMLLLDSFKNAFVRNDSLPIIMYLDSCYGRFGNLKNLKALLAACSNSYVSAFLNNAIEILEYKVDSWDSSVVYNLYADAKNRPQLSNASDNSEKKSVLVPTKLTATIGDSLDYLSSKKFGNLNVSIKSPVFFIARVGLIDEETLSFCQSNGLSAVSDILALYKDHGNFSCFYNDTYNVERNLKNIILYAAQKGWVVLHSPNKEMNRRAKESDRQVHCNPNEKYLISNIESKVERSPKYKKKEGIELSQSEKNTKKVSTPELPKLTADNSDDIKINVQSIKKINKQGSSIEHPIRNKIQSPDSLISKKDRNKSEELTPSKAVRVPICSPNMALNEERAQWLTDIQIAINWSLSKLLIKKAISLSTFIYCKTNRLSTCRKIVEEYEVKVIDNKTNRFLRKIFVELNDIKLFALKKGWIKMEIRKVSNQTDQRVSSLGKAVSTWDSKPSSFAIRDSSKPLTVKFGEVLTPIEKAMIDGCTVYICQDIMNCKVIDHTTRLFCYNNGLESVGDVLRYYERNGNFYKFYDDNPNIEKNLRLLILYAHAYQWVELRDK